MHRCIELAKKATGKTYPNPLVGSVIVHNDRIIGEGFHEKAGEAHAEIRAIESVQDCHLLKDATLYVSLEPCAHFGRTPPCALKLIEIGLKKVVIGAMDVHDKVNGKGKKLLENAGIEVISGILESECEILNRRFFTFHKKKRPHLVLKWAESGDRYIDKDFIPTAISNAFTKQWVHQLRSEEHSILVGTNTALRDNPSLTTRNIVGRNPVRILIDADLKVPLNFNIFNEEATTIVFNSKKNECLGNREYIKISRQNFLEQMLQKLYEKEIQSVLVEGGAHVLQQFIDANLWDEIMVIKNPGLTLKSGTKAPSFSADKFQSEDFHGNTIDFYQNKSSYTE